jgi:hypothetical protein
MPDVSRQHSGLIFKSRNVPLKMRSLLCLERRDTNQPVTQRYIEEEGGYKASAHFFKSNGFLSPCTIQEVMSLTHQASKGKRMDTIEELHIQQYYHQHKLIPEQNLHESNPLFQLQYETQLSKNTEIIILL